MPVPRHASRVIRHSSFLIFITLLFLSALPIPAEPHPLQQSADTLIKEALAEFQSGRLEPAIEKLRAAYKGQPQNPFARLYLGLLLYQQDPGSLEAQGLMESVADRFATNPDLLIRLTDSYLSSGKKDKVVPLLDRGKAARASNPRLALNLVYLLVRYAQTDLAMRALDDFSPESGAAAGAKAAPPGPAGEVSFLRGLIAATVGRKEEAMQQFQAADKNDFPPRDSPQMKMLAEALYRFEEYALAAQAYQVYLSHFPQDTDARLQLAINYFSSASFSRAQEQFQNVYEQAPRMPQVNYYLGRVALETKNHEEARKRFEVELRINPNSSPAMVELAYLDYTGGNNDKCLEWLKKAAALSPDYSELHFVYGLLYNRQGKYDLAIQNLESVIQSNPKHITAQYQLSVAYRRVGNDAKAKEHADIYDKLLEEHRKRTLGEDVRR